MKYYTGIGSRKTPSDVLVMMTAIAEHLNKDSYILRSGGAEGADKAFHDGAIRYQIFVPWDGYNGYKLIYKIIDKCFTIAEKYHPVWNKLSDPVKFLMARNVMQILGYDLKTPSEFVICWTPDGCTTKEQRTSKTGGTGLAIALANDYNIPIYNLKNGIPDFLLNDLKQKDMVHD